ncbi:hypothetical protein P170DRAFT_468499 [Aspergillus steynii IBT 23096]|uniref:Uncharacterized protein n=1 Tax=Aspergillus steynii IBT 23096 TaxID=1392250 RepID=A0A2I2FSV4_9EURO|nr:uncharacterized protein P170DRAFT_468499 [Aspergillus steynii IBT 23096]PLB43715.1 hypothetical protein P170DRAFT_468499 [Aspergillus steynii IBT 23096]
MGLERAEIVNDRVGEGDQLVWKRLEGENAGWEAKKRNHRRDIEAPNHLDNNVEGEELGKWRIGSKEPDARKEKRWGERKRGKGGTSVEESGRGSSPKRTRSKAVKDCVVSSRIYRPLRFCAVVGRGLCHVRVKYTGGAKTSNDWRGEDLTATAPDDGAVSCSERHGWKIAKYKNFSPQNNRSLTIPSAELEKMDFKKNPGQWSFFYRSIIEDPQTGDLRVSGIFPGATTRMDDEAGRPPTDYYSAQIHGKVIRNDDQNSVFHMVNLYKPDWNREHGQLVGYPIHSDCWLLLDRVIGHDVIKRNLRLFVKAVEVFWSIHRRNWEYAFSRIPRDDQRGERDSWVDLWPDNSFYQHTYCSLSLWSTGKTTQNPGSPYQIPDIDRLIARVTRVQDSRMGGLSQPRRSTLPALPPEIKIMIVDTIYNTRPLSRDRTQDVRNTLEAFGWKLPDSFWQN